MEAVKEVKRKPKKDDKVMMVYGGRVCLISYVHNDSEVDLREYGGAKFNAKSVPVSALIFTDENGNFPPPQGWEEDTSADAEAVKDLSQHEELPALDSLLAQGLVSQGMPEPPTIPEAEMTVDEKRAAGHFQTFDTMEELIADLNAPESDPQEADPYFDKWAYLGEVDPQTGAIGETSLAVISDTAYLETFQSDKTLIALTEHILAIGRSELDNAPAVGDIQNARAQVKGIETYLRGKMAARDAKIDACNNLNELILRYERYIGDFLKAMPKNKGAQGTGSNQHKEVQYPRGIAPTLSELGVAPKQSSRWQKVAGVPLEVFEDYMVTSKETRHPISGNELLKQPQQGYDGDEWYTPTDFIEAARLLMGEIDCDPASCDLAQRVVKASRYFTKANDGLKQDWTGNVWLNPPYSQPKIEEFTTRLIEQYEAGITTEAVLLVNNCTDAGWFIALARRYPMMFSVGRAQFWQADQKTFATRQGQAIFYLGTRIDRFLECFNDLAYAPNVLDS